MTDLSRRNFLKTSTAAAAGFALIRSLTPKEIFGAEALSGASTRIVPFPLAPVRLSPGLFKEQAEINARYFTGRSDGLALLGSAVRLASAWI